MKNKKKIYNLLSKKENIKLRKVITKKNTLIKELNSNESTKLKLNKVIKENIENKNQKTGGDLKAENWYNTKIKDQIIKIDNRINFLLKEIKDQNILLATSKEKSKKYKQRFTEMKKNEIQEIEKKNEAALQYRIVAKY